MKMLSKTDEGELGVPDKGSCVWWFVVGFRESFEGREPNYLCLPGESQKP
jgi:hypothetical protein